MAEGDFYRFEALPQRAANPPGIAADPLWRRTAKFKVPHVMKIDGTWRELFNPEQQSIIDAETVFLSGHSYVVDFDLYTELVNAGYEDSLTLIEVPVPPGPVYAAIDEASMTTFFSAANDNITLDVPVGTATGDLLVACVTWQTASEPTGPMGWSSLTWLGGTNSDYRGTKVFFLPVTGAPPAGPEVFTLSGGGRAAGFMFRVTGADLNDPIAASGGVSSRVGSVVTVPELPASAGNLVVAVVNGQATSGQIAHPLGYSPSMTNFAAVESSTNTSITRSFVAGAWAESEADFPELTVTPANPLSSDAGMVFAIRAVT